MLLSIFIADYTNVFPSVLITYDSLEIKDQIIINFLNKIARNQNYSINDSIKVLD